MVGKTEALSYHLHVQLFESTESNLDTCELMKLVQSKSRCHGSKDQGVPF